MPETSDHDAPKRLYTMGEIRTEALESLNQPCREALRALRRSALG
jgi:hypothetical protein